MRANSPSAFLFSLTLHGIIAALIIFLTYYSVWQQGPPPVIFELVAGPPTAPDELVAPALGNSLTPVKMELPKADPTPVQPEPKVEEVVQTVKTDQTPPSSEVVPPPVKPKPKPDNSLLKEMKRTKTMSYREYMKQHPTPKPVAQAKPRTGNVPKIDAEGIAQGVKGGSTANKRGGGGGKALTREEQNEFNTYISFLIAALKEAHNPPPGVSDKLEAKVTFDITANGHILNPRISRSSGDKDFDESVLEAFRKMRSIGPTPDGKSASWTVLFRQRDE
jgi:colicin import membrane protein